MNNVGSDEDIALEVIKRSASEWLPEQYLPFAMYAIRSRALVSDDGLKPVNRRILWSLFQKGFTDTSKHLKAARAAADAVAYHPHGSASVEDALARMAQGFSLRVPLIDPYGSVGIVSGDTAAAARYWEARLSIQAMELVKEIPEGAVELGKNFDGELDEPVILPVRWPVAVVNGTQGIAVGYASNMFAHNPDEVMDACRKMLKDPEMTLKQLLKIMPGPDLPTGGELLEIDGVKEYYETGSGRFTIRGTYDTETLTRGKVKMTFNELPYQVSATDVIQKINELQKIGKLKDIASVKDLTDKKNGLRLVIETKSGTNHLSILNELFKLTKLEEKFSVNSTILVDNSPVKVSMLSQLSDFIEFRKECVLRKADTRIGKIDNRLSQLNAILAILLDIDTAIAIIRKSDTANDARSALVIKFSTKKFTMTNDQADYILSMQLRRLTKQDSLAIQNEKTALEAERKELQLVLSSEAKLIEMVDGELVATKKVISSERRTTISNMTAEELKESQKKIAQEVKKSDKNLPCVVTRFANGKLMKSEEPFKYKPTVGKTSKSPIVEQISMNSHDSFVVIGTDGLGRRIPLSYLTDGLPLSANKAGVKLPTGVEIAGICKSVADKNDTGVAIATKLGGIKISKTDFPRGDEFPVCLLDDGDKVVGSRWIGPNIKDTWFVMVSKNGSILVFDATSIRVAGAKAGTVRGMKLKDGSDKVVGFSWIKSNTDMNTMVLSKAESTLKMTSITEIAPKGRGSQGVTLHGFSKGEKSIKSAYAGAEIVATLEDGKTVVPAPPLTKRATKGAAFPSNVMFGVFSVEPQ